MGFKTVFFFSIFRTGPFYVLTTNRHDEQTREFPVIHFHCVAVLFVLAVRLPTCAAAGTASIASIASIRGFSSFLNVSYSVQNQKIDACLSPLSVVMQCNSRFPLRVVAV